MKCVSGSAVVLTRAQLGLQVWSVVGNVIEREFQKVCPSLRKCSGIESKINAICKYLLVSVIAYLNV
jgi:hypothetical protein